MRKIKYEDHLESLGLCECLIPLIQFEVKQGNKIMGYDTNGGWPEKGSHLIYLRQQLHLKHPDFPQHPNVNAMINRDIHCNWKTDAYCNFHHHLIIG
ncbi:hypothetical protein [Acinetobacter shaoyimingii]|uniref:Uncharacterized protein n=1 Tax=Acinetobacter shaoyimingii TaxID=2715164 RepID=A0A6G8RYN3_9GAMM|nr:hypothetical protein [Acinetobacter shaoyimingii]QIO06975.1 hypothetical protein G8E00_14050 [Acinetobacter shaoyimingii]